VNKFFIFKFNQNYLFKKMFGMDIFNEKDREFYFLRIFFHKKTAQKFEQFYMIISKKY